MGETLKGSEARFNVLIIQFTQAVKTEGFHGEGSHDASENNRPPEPRLGKIFRGGEASHKAAGERIAGAGGIFHRFQRKRRCAEDVLVGKHQDAVLPTLDNETFGSASQHVFGDFHQIRLLAECACFPVVDNEHVNVFQQVPEGVAFRVDPEIHGVARDHVRSRHLIQHVHLKFRVDVS